MTIGLLVTSILRSVVEVALLSLLAQGMLGLLSGAARENNLIYQLFGIIARPPIRFIRFVVPKLIVDKHIPFAAFFTLFWLWILLAYIKRAIVG